MSNQPNDIKELDYRIGISHALVARVTNVDLKEFIDRTLLQEARKLVEKDGFTFIRLSRVENLPTISDVFRYHVTVLVGGEGFIVTDGSFKQFANKMRREASD